MPTETLSNGVENNKENWIKNALDGLEKSVWGQYFKNAINRFKSTLGIDKKDGNNGNNGNKGTESQGTSHVDHPSSGPDYSKVDKNGFSPGEYPFAHIKTPYMGISSYRVDNIKLHPLLGFSQLSLKGTEGPMITLKVKEQTLKYTNKNAIGVKKNNPCNVSPYEGDIGRSGSSKVADGQNHGKYNTMEDGLASFMKLMRTGKNKKTGEYKYRNKSIQGINCGGLQGVYEPNEPDSLKALRITWITHACEKLHVSPFDRINTDDKETMMAFAQQTAINETGSYFDRTTLENAYKKAFG